MRRAFVAVTALVVALVLAQAALAGQFLFAGGDIVLHGHVGNASFALSVVAVVLAVLAQVPRWVQVLSALLVVALFSQTGLGYVGRESTTAAAWHIPLGVASFGVAVAALTGAIAVRLGAAR